MKNWTHFLPQNTKSTERLKKTIRCLKAAKEDNGQLIAHQNQKRNIPGIRRKL
jgi:hypothetical protein